MGDGRALEKLDKLITDDYHAAFFAICEQMAHSELCILKAHCESPNYVVSATEITSKVGSANYNASNYSNDRGG